MESLWSRLSWPQVVALAVLVAGVVAILVAVPIEKLTAIPWEGVAGVVAVLLGGGAASVMGPIVRPRSSTSSSTPPRARPTEPPPPPTAGFVDVDTMLAILLWAVLGLVALTHLSGCGAGALGGHRRAASLAAIVETVTDAAVADACPPASTSPACEIAIPAAKSLGVAVDAYRDATKLAGAIEEGTSVVPPLIALARGVLDVVDIIADALGLPPELDAILAFIRSLVGAGASS